MSVVARVLDLRVAVALLGVGLVFGTALDRSPPSIVEERAGYRVLESDFHAHTRFSDGLLPPWDLVLQAKRRGLDVLGITEHNTVLAGKLGAAFSRAIGGPSIVVGEEVTTNRYHFIALGLTRTVDASQPLADAIADVHAQNGVAIVAHPVRRFWDRLIPAIPLFDGTEVMHPIAYRTGEGVSWRWKDMVDFYDEAAKSGHPLAAIGSSDYHMFSVLGVTRTLVFAKDDEPASVVDAIRAHRTVVVDLDGKQYGDPAMIAALAKEPYTLREEDYGYRGKGALDRVTRALGWLGLAGVIFLRAKKRVA